MQQKIQIRRSLLALALFGLTATLASACPNPIFQYALQYWAPDPYRVTARGAEAWPAEQRAALRLFQDAERFNRANLRVRLEPAATNTSGAAASSAPRLEVNFADANGIPRTVWSGKPSIETAQRLLNSPARTEIGRLLLQGKTTVWILLESGDRRKDNEAAGLLQKELRRMETVLAASEPEPWGGSGGWGGPPQQASPPIAFGFLRLRRDDPTEAMLVRMLLASKPGLEQKTGETLAFPIYGRGLILDVLAGSDIEPQRLWAVAEFLTGPCSCTFKEAWHGASLLMSVDWQSRPDAVQDNSPPLGAPISASGFLRRMEPNDTKGVQPATPPEKDKTKP